MILSARRCAHHAHKQAISVFALLGFLAACDLRLPVEALPAPAASGPEKAEAPVLLGTYTTPSRIPDAPGVGSSYLEPAPTSLYIPPNTYGLIRITGRILLEGNPWLLGGGSLGSYTAVQAQSASVGRTRLWVRFDGQTEPPAGGIQPLIRPDANGEDMVALIRTGAQGATMWAGRDRLPVVEMFQGWCIQRPYCGASETQVESVGFFDRLYVEQAYVAQANTVTLTRVPEPLAVTGPAGPVAPDQSVTLTVSPTAGMRLRHPQAETADVTWLWYWDNVGAEPDPNGGSEIVACHGTSCTFTPGGSGRIRVATWIEGAYVDAWSQVVRVEDNPCGTQVSASTSSSRASSQSSASDCGPPPQPPEPQPPHLTLSCAGLNPAGEVTRGGTVTCRAVGVPSGTPQGTRWSFTTERGDTVAGPAGAASWGGVIVIGGTLKVSATLDGVPTGADTQIVVVKRAWERQMPPYPSALPRDSIAPAEFPALPVTVASNGYDVWPNGTLAFYDFSIAYVGGLTDVRSGPNTGYWYFPAAPGWEIPRVFLSGHLQPGHRFYEAQQGTPRPPGAVLPAGYSGWCTKADMDSLRTEMRMHEGSVAGYRLSHHQFNISYTRQNDAGPAMEGVIFRVPPGGRFADAARGELGRAYETNMEAANNAAVHAASNTFKVTCKAQIP
jgi:hypothetical protein